MEMALQDKQRTIEGHLQSLFGECPVKPDPVDTDKTLWFRVDDREGPIQHVVGFRFDFIRDNPIDYIIGKLNQWELKKEMEKAGKRKLTEKREFRTLVGNLGIVMTWPA